MPTKSELIELGKSPKIEIIEKKEELEKERLNIMKKTLVLIIIALIILVISEMEILLVQKFV